MRLISNAELDDGCLLNRNFEVESDGLTMVFSVHALFETKQHQTDRDSEPETEIFNDYITVTFKEAWSDDWSVNIPVRRQYELEEELTEKLKEIWN